MSDIADFLRARIAERRALADSIHNRSCESVPDILYPDRETGACDCGEPEAVIADSDAKLALIDAYLPEGADPHPGLPCINYDGQDPKLYGEYDSCSRHLAASNRLIRSDYIPRILAQPFVGHPDHKGEEWAP